MNKWLHSYRLQNTWYKIISPLYTNTRGSVEKITIFESVLGSDPGLNCIYTLILIEFFSKVFLSLTRGMPGWYLKYQL